MTTAEREPTKDELLAMAYADGELAGAELVEFERALAHRDDLRREVARLQRLHVLARHCAGPEPMDHEWSALRRDPLHRAGMGLGLTLFALGGSALILFALWALWAGDAPTVLKAAITAVLAGAALLLATFVRARVRTRVYDPYREIQR